MSIREHSKKDVSYIYDNFTGFYFGKNHPMKPFRNCMANELILRYGLYQKMKVYRPTPATFQDFTQFHGEDYVNYLKSCTIKNITNELKSLGRRFSIGTSEKDCPFFDGLYEFCQKSAGGSIAAASLINKKSSEICINWAGGMHHAKKSEASGFCYINDIVLCILELLKEHKRVLYIDIDVHHGDGVEEAFYTTDRVLCVSFHRFGEDFFPCTGGMTDIGAGQGKHYSLNVPLKSGMTDNAYASLFVPIISRVFEVYQPSSVVLQCGADSLKGDRLGDFNLTLKGHGNCVKFLRSFNVPLILLGGGGYTVKNVSRCWTYETSIALGYEIPNQLPYNDFYGYFEDDHHLHIEADPNVINKNSDAYMHELIINSFEKLRNINIAPSVEYSPVSQSFLDEKLFTETKEENPDQPPSEDRSVIPDNEFYD